MVFFLFFLAFAQILVLIKLIQAGFRNSQSSCPSSEPWSQDFDLDNFGSESEGEGESRQRELEESKRHLPFAIIFSKKLADKRGDNMGYN